MPFSQAKALFENISSGCPVICYKTNVRAVTNVKEFQAAQPAKNVENNYIIYKLSYVWIAILRQLYKIYLIYAVLFSNKFF